MDCPREMSRNGKSAAEQDAWAPWLYTRGSGIFQSQRWPMTSPKWRTVRDADRRVPGAWRCSVLPERPRERKAREHCLSRAPATLRRRGSSPRRCSVAGLSARGRFPGRRRDSSRAEGRAASHGAPAPGPPDQRSWKPSVSPTEPSRRVTNAGFGTDCSRGPGQCSPHPQTSSQTTCSSFRPPTTKGLSDQSLSRADAMPDTRCTARARERFFDCLLVLPS